MLNKWITTHCPVPEQRKSNQCCVTSCRANHVWNTTKPSDFTKMTKDLQHNEGRFAKSGMLGICTCLVVQSLNFTLPEFGRATRK